MAAGATCTISIVFLPQTSGLLQEPLTVTDADGDTATLNLAGTGDNLTLQLASSTPTQISVNEGGTATYGAQIVPDAVFGTDGEKVALQCPATSALPTDVSCAITPCPASVTAGTATNITVTIVTSSNEVVAPVPEGPAGCVSYGPGPVTTAPTTTAELIPKRGPENFFGGGWPRGTAPWRFPALPAPGADATFALGAVFAGFAAFATWWVLSGANATRRAALFAAVALVALATAGCHSKKNILHPETVPGNYAFSIQATATDVNGNSFSASREVQLNLDVVVGTVSTGFGTQ